MKVTDQNLHLDHQQWPNVVLPIHGKIAGSDAFMSKLVFLPLPYNGKVKKLTRPEVTEIKSLICLFCRHRVSHEYPECLTLMAQKL